MALFSRSMVQIVVVDVVIPIVKDLRNVEDVVVEAVEVEEADEMVVNSLCTTYRYYT